jgi:hypothetical protein
MPKGGALIAGYPHVWLALLAGAALGCTGGKQSESEGGQDAAASVFDLCDAFTEVGAACPGPSPILCFPMCEAGGCTCSVSPSGPRWTCATDLSCVPDCAPLDDGCPGSE